MYFSNHLNFKSSLCKSLVKNVIVSNRKFWFSEQTILVEIRNNKFEIDSSKYKVPAGRLCHTGDLDNLPEPFRTLELDLRNRLAFEQFSGIADCRKARVGSKCIVRCRNGYALTILASVPPAVLPVA